MGAGVKGKDGDIAGETEGEWRAEERGRERKGTEGG